MNILLATPNFPPGIGHEATYTKELCSRISSKHNVTVISYTSSKDPLPNTKLISINKHQPVTTRLFQYTLAVWKNRRGTDVIYTQNAMAAGLPVAIASVLTRIPFTLKFLSDESWERAVQYKLTNKNLEDFLDKPEGGWKIKLMQMIQGFVFRKASIITTPTDHIGNVLSKYYKIDRNKIITNFNTVEEPEILPFPSTRVPNQILVVNKLSEGSDIHTIIKTVAKLEKAIPDITLNIVGHGHDYNNIRRLSEELGISNKVTFRDHVSRAEMWYLFKKASLFIQTNNNKEFAKYILNSFSTKTPVISLGVHSVDEILVNGQTGLIAENEDSLENAIKKMLTNHEFSEIMIQNAEKLILEKFSWEKHLSVLEKTLESVGAKPSN